MARSHTTRRPSGPRFSLTAIIAAIAICVGIAGTPAHPPQRHVVQFATGGTQEFQEQLAAVQAAQQRKACLLPMSEADEDLYEQYLADTGQTRTYDSIDDSTTVCIATPDDNGGYIIHYVKKSDGMDDFKQYVVAIVRAQSLAGPSGIADPELLDAGDRIILDYLVEVVTDDMDVHQHVNTVYVFDQTEQRWIRQHQFLGAITQVMAGIIAMQEVRKHRVAHAVTRPTHRYTAAAAPQPTRASTPTATIASPGPRSGTGAVPVRRDKVVPVGYSPATLPRDTGKPARAERVTPTGKKTAVSRVVSTPRR